MNTIFVILVGSSNLLYSCARIVKEHYQDNVQLKVIDVAYSPMSQKYQSEFGRTDEYANKEEVFGYLDTIQTPAYILSVNNPYLFPDRFALNPMLTLINLHHAILPYHPGRNAEAWAIYEQDNVAGITWHYISGPGIDTGEIICQKQVGICDTTTSLMLLKKCEQVAKESLENLLPLEDLNRCDAIKQPTNISRTPRKAKEVPNNGFLDIEWSVYKISCFLRAMDYGIINVFPKPRCIVDNTEFEICKYSISKTDAQTQKSVYLEESNADTFLVVKQYDIVIKMKLKQ